MKCLHDRTVDMNFDIMMFSFGAVLKKKQIEGEKVTQKDVRKIVRILTLWRGNPISCMKLFGKMTCSLCMKERLYILRAMRKEPGKIIN